MSDLLKDLKKLGRRHMDKKQFDDCALISSAIYEVITQKSRIKELEKENALLKGNLNSKPMKYVSNGGSCIPFAHSGGTCGPNGGTSGMPIEGVTGDKGEE